MRGLLPVAFLLVVLAAEPAAAIPPEGSRSAPEVSDGTGDVQYPPTYLGDRNRDWLDLVSFWIEYSPSLDVVTFSFEVVDLTELETLTMSSVNYHAYIDGFVEEDHVGLMDLWLMFDGSGEPNCACSMTVQGQGKDLNANLEVVFSRPGFMHVNVTREVLQLHVTSLRSPEIQAAEFEETLPTYEMNVGQDNASAEAAFDIARLRPDSRGDGDDALPSNPNYTPTKDEPQRVKTAGLGLALSAAVVLSVAAWRRRPN